MFSALTSRVRSGQSIEDSPPRQLHSKPPRKLRTITFGASRVLEPSNPDYLAQKHKLDHLAAFLSAALTGLVDTMAAWTAIARKQSHFAALVAQAGVPGSSTRSRCARAARSTANCAADIAPAAMRAAVVPDAMEQLRRFQTHVAGLQERYRDIRKMKRETETCAQRLRATQGKFGGGNEAVAKAEARYERGKELYEAMVRRMAERMADANRRTPEVVRTVHYLYWLLQDKALKRLEEATQAEMGAADAAEPLLCYSTFCHGLRAPASMFNSLEVRQGPASTR